VQGVHGVHLDTQAQAGRQGMVAIASPAARAKQRGPRKQVQRSEQVEEAVKERQRKRARKAASGGNKRGARLRGSTLSTRAHSPATEDFDDRLDLRLKILPRLEGVPDRGDLCSHRCW
jgi:hypothetical protein